jgi:hypothetical protein
MRSCRADDPNAAILARDTGGVRSVNGGLTADGGATIALARALGSCRNGNVVMFADPLILALAGHLVVTATEKVPALNLEPSCRGASQAAMPGRDGSLPTPAEMRAACLAKERAAREQLMRQWKDFAADHRASCIRSTSAGGVPSYIELLTCLEIADQARKLPDEPLRGTTGLNRRDLR